MTGRAGYALLTALSDSFYGSRIQWAFTYYGIGDFEFGKDYSAVRADLHFGEEPVEVGSRELEDCGGYSSFQHALTGPSFRTNARI